MNFLNFIGGNLITITIMIICIAETVTVKMDKTCTQGTLQARCIEPKSDKEWPSLTQRPWKTTVPALACFHTTP